jgi:hypothetical protein
MQNALELNEELETAFQTILPNDQVDLEDVVAKWKAFTAQIQSGPCPLTPEDFCLQIAISRNLLELVLESVDESSQGLLLSAIEETDAAYRQATIELKFPLAQEEETPRWYLLRGPQAFAPEAHPELWDFYVGKSNGLDEDQLAELDEAARSVCEDEQATVTEILQHWKEFVVNVERGYDNLPDEYELGVWQGRGNLEQIRMDVSEPVGAALEAILAPWDVRFEKATRVVLLDPEEDEDADSEDEPAFLRRAPLKFRLGEEELQAWMDA